MKRSKPIKKLIALILIVLMFGLFLPVPVSTQQEYSADEYYNTAYKTFQKQQYEQTFEYCKKAIEMYKKAGIKNENYAYAYILLGRIYADYYSQYDEAIKMYQKAIKLAKEIGKEEIEAFSYNNIGAVYDSQGKYKEALENYRKALAINKKAYGEEHPDVAINYNNIGEVYRKQGKYEEALENYRKALAINKKAYGEEHPDVAIDYNNIGAVYYDKKDYHNAEQNFVQAVNIIEKIRKQGGFSAKEDYDMLVQGYRDILKHPLNPGEKYYKQGASIYSSRGVRVKEKKIEKKEKISYKQARKELNECLYKSLIEPVLKETKDKTITIIPSGILGFLPYETLQDEQGEYLIQKREIRYSPSVSILYKVRRKSKSMGIKTILCFGGAKYEKEVSAKEYTKLSEKEKEYYIALARGGEGIDDIYRNQGISWEELPGTLKEVEEIGELYYTVKSKDFNNSIIREGKVSEERIKQMSRIKALKKYRMLHFAVHGNFDVQLPELSCVVLSRPELIPEKEQKKYRVKEDGYLTLGEVMVLELDSDLVMLSACQTGLGEIMSGEGVIGLTQSFLMAGTRRVGVSLWSVADVSTKEFMIAFYKKLKAGKDSHKAIKQVKLEFIKSKKWSHPYFWSPFVLYGK